MNTSMITYTLGWVLKLEGFFMIPSCLVALIYQEKAGWAFAVTIVMTLAAGMYLTRKKPQNRVFYVKEGFVSVALSWIVMSAVGSVPFVISDSIKIQ